MERLIQNIKNAIKIKELAEPNHNGIRTHTLAISKVVINLFMLFLKDKKKIKKNNILMKPKENLLILLKEKACLYQKIRIIKI